MEKCVRLSDVEKLLESVQDTTGCPSFTVGMAHGFKNAIGCVKNLPTVELPDKGMAITLTADNIARIGQEFLDTFLEANVSEVNDDLVGQIRGMEQMLKLLGVPCKIRYSGDMRRYVGVEIAGKAFSMT